MKRTDRRRHGKPPFDLVEEAIHLLRMAPVATWSVYYLGAIPFVLGLLFFWADMSRSPMAPQNLAGASLGMAALFVWMKFWQAVFAARVRAQAAGERNPPLTVRRCLRILVAQLVIQPSGLFLLPLAIIPLLPFARVYSFYQNATALDHGNEAGTGALLKQSKNQARFWPGQNHFVLAIMLAFAAGVFLNWTTVCLTLPQLVKLLFGIESDFTMNTRAMLNTTFFAAMAGLTYLSVDPILKTIYTLRCFYGESIESGEDLKADLKLFVSPALKAAPVILGLLMLFCQQTAFAQSTNAPAGPQIRQTISPQDLDQTINQTIHEQKYLWRMPREQNLESPDANRGIVMQFFEKIGGMIREWARTVWHWVKVILDDLFRNRVSHRTTPDSPGYGWIMAPNVLLYGLAIAAITALLILLFRVWQPRRMPPPAVVGELIQPVPDLTDENVRADQLPEDGWIKLGRELLDRGEFRLAMRAFYLAGLAQLAARNLVTIARYKSNRDYERELRRRAHALPGLLPIFAENVSVFERIWYGLHEASRDMADQFAANLERLKGSQ